MKSHPPPIYDRRVVDRLDPDYQPPRHSFRRTALIAVVLLVILWFLLVKPDGEFRHQKEILYQDPVKQLPHDKAGEQTVIRRRKP
jgi:hypothetical protein